MSDLPEWAQEKPGHPLQNWRCKCGRPPSMEHQVGGFCEGKNIIERYEKALAIAWEALSKNVEYNHRDAEGPELRAQNEGNYRRSKDAMRRIEELGK